jgi:uncharacterized protein YjbI with pentapeptide repeats
LDIHEANTVNKLLIALLLNLALVCTCYAQPDIQNNYNGAYLEGRSFAGQDLKQAKFYKANLRGVNFTGANLRGASFFAASMRNVNLQKTRLEDSELSNADLRGAKLDQAVLERAYLTAAKLKGVTIVGADFTETIINNEQKIYLCTLASGMNTITKRQTRKTLGC